ncbi:MAG: pyridoxal-phosphate dependent enzyme [Woeseiaceae bacterium]
MEAIEPILLDEVSHLTARLAKWLRRTPVVDVSQISTADTAQVVAKLELWQETGSFKARGALANMLALPADQFDGVTAVSAGNHAIATAFAAKTLGFDAKVVMTATAPEIRVKRCRAYGAEVVLAPDVHQAFEIADSLAQQENRAFIHPFEGRTTAIATGGVGLELVKDVEDLDAVIVPVGGGGLAAGVATAVRLASPQCEVFGVEPEGANSMSLSFERGAPASLEAINTIADSLGAPMALPVSYALCRASLTDIAIVSDRALKASMQRIFEQLGFAVEPACAAALAALNGPLAKRLANRRVGLIFCGSNIDIGHWHRIADR